MTAINLYQQSSGEMQPGRKRRGADSSFVLSLGIFILTFLVFGGVKIYAHVLQNNQEDLKNRILQEQAGLTGNTAQKIKDIDTRLSMIKANQAKPAMTDILDNVASALVGGAVVESYNYGGGMITLEMRSDNYYTVAKQLMSFKTAGAFEGAAISDMQRDEHGIGFNVDMRLVSGDLASK